MINRYPNLLFFNKSGDVIQTTFNPDLGYYEGTIILKETSNGLIENETIYLLEKLLDNTSAVRYGIPHLDLSLSNTKVRATLDNTKQKGIKLFTLDNPTLENPNLTFVPEITVDFDDDPSDMLHISGIIKTNLIRDKALRFDIAVNSDVEGIWESNLIIADSAGTIAKINVYSETVGEDERFSNLLSNFGELISDQHTYIFREANIHEELPDWKLLNTKRKEFLVEVNSLKPYYSTYKGILGTLFLFGYSDLRLKEYWLNVETGKYFFEDVKLNEIEKLNDPFNYRGQHLQKTSYFGLFYDINIVTDEEDEEGLPITKKNFSFSNEEIIIKLFGLRKYIQERNIGGVSQIIDIVGEAVHFNRMSINTWNDRSVTLHIDDTIKIGFEVDKKEGFIEDVRPILRDYSTCVTDPDADVSGLQLANLYGCFVGHFADYYQENPNYLDEAGIPVGCPIVLTDKSFSLPWNKISTTWNETNTAALSYTWNNIAFGDFYESEWIIERQFDINDPRPYINKVRRTVWDNQVLSLILPYTGVYTIQLKLYGYNGRYLQHTKKRYLTVRTKQADFLNFFRHIEPRLQVWSTCNLKWNEIESEWNKPIYKNQKYTLKLNEIQFETYNMNNFLSIDYYDDKNVRFAPNNWSDFNDVTWKDYSFITWNNLFYNSEKLGKAIITDIMANGEIQIGDDVFTIPSDYNIHDFYRLAQTLSALSPSLHPKFNNFDYIYRNINTVQFIEINAKTVGKSGEEFFGSSGGVVVKSQFDYDTWRSLHKFKWNDVMTTWSNAQNLVRSQYLDNAFTMDNIRVYEDEFHVTVMTPVFFSFDNSKMPGKTKAVWKIIDNTNITNKTITTVNNTVLVYKFDQVGDYSVEIEIEDTNGNKNKRLKKKVIHVLTPTEFEQLSRFNKEI